MVAVAALAAGIVAASAPVAQARTFVVTRSNDPVPDGCRRNDCSLREAVIAANNRAGLDTIELAQGTYRLLRPGTDEDMSADGDLDVTDPLKILGAGPGKTRIDGGGATTGERVFHVLSSRLTLRGLRVQNSTDGSLAGIYAAGSDSALRLRDTVVKGHTATVCCSGIVTEGALTLRDSKVLGNTAGSCCAGIFHAAQGRLALQGVLVRGNRSSGCCAGIYSDTPKPTRIIDSRVLKNRDETNCCVGIMHFGDGSFQLRRVRVNDNISETCCTGIYVENVPLRGKDVQVSGNEDLLSCCSGIRMGGGGRLRDSTISGNSAPECCAGIITFETSRLSNVTISGNHTADAAGGLWNVGTATLNNVTVTRNRADTDNAGGGDGGGISNDVGATLILRNSIVARNTVGSTGVGPDCHGTITSGGYNLIGDATDCTIVGKTTGNRIGANARLKPLRSNGGFTKTHALAKRSAAVNRGSPKKQGPTVCMRRDQRGVKRVDCDMGSFELV